MNIREIQAALAACGYSPGPVDGVNGPKTRSAIRAFQQAVGLVVDGIAGRQTQAALRQAVTPIKPGRPEPDKGGIFNPPDEPADTGGSAATPPNYRSIKLLATARPINEIINHCTATPEGKDFTVADIRAWHKARGFSDVGYHFVVYRDGSVHAGRPIGQIGSHVAGRNTGTIGVSYVGGLTADGKRAKDTRTPEQRAALLWLNKALVARHPGIRKISGHNQYANKACPSFNVPDDALGKII